MTSAVFNLIWCDWGEFFALQRVTEWFTYRPVGRNQAVSATISRLLEGLSLCVGEAGISWT